MRWNKRFDGSRDSLRDKSHRPISTHPSIIAQGVGNFRLFYSVFILYGVMVMTITFFQSIGNGKKAGMIVMLRQLFLFVPAMIFLPMAFGIKAVWFTQPLVDFIMITVGILMMLSELNKMGKDKA